MSLTVALRELFWHNVLQEMLTALSVLAMERHSSIYSEEVERQYRETFDGRLAVITRTGQRIPIAEVHPLFACSIAGTQSERSLSAAVQCSVFQIRTPGGESYTLPLHEIRAFHALSEELIERLKSIAEAHESKNVKKDEREPFGFAAFTSLSRSQGDSSGSEAPAEIDEGV